MKPNKTIVLLAVLGVGLIAWQPLMHQIDVWKLESSAKDDPIMNQAPKPTATEPVKPVAETPKQAQISTEAPKAVQTTTQTSNTSQNSNNGTESVQKDTVADSKATIVVHNGFKFRNALKIPGIDPPGGVANATYWKSDKNELFALDSGVWISVDGDPEMAKYKDSTLAPIYADFDSCGAGAYLDYSASLKVQNCN